MRFNNDLRMHSQAFLAFTISLVCTYIFFSVFTSPNLTSILDIALDIYFLTSVCISIFIYQNTNYESFGITLFMMSFLSADLIRFF